MNTIPKRRPARKAKLAAVSGGVVIHDNAMFVVLTPSLARQIAKELPSLAALADGLKDSQPDPIQPQPYIN